MHIKITSLNKQYHNHVTALKSINLSISRGIFGLLGPNGAGKSTLMNILATLLPPTEGEVMFNDLRLGRDDRDIRKLLGYLPQQFGLYPTLTGQEFLHYIAKLRGIHDFNERQRKVASILERVNLADKSKAKIKTYSGGMKQRLGIAQALIGDPQAIIVDEPTAGLDPEERLRLRHLLADLSTSCAVLLSTHIVSDIESSCTQVAVMNKGVLLYNGKPSELLKQTYGKLWTCTVSHQEYNEMSMPARQNITNKRVTEDGYELRILSSQAPAVRSVVTDPSLEDAYMALLGGI